MERLDVVTHDDEKVVGHVVDKIGAYYIVEHGLLRKTKHALPEQFGRLDEDGGRLVILVSKELLHDSPTLNGDIDEQAVASHYGLADTTVDEPADYDDEAVIEDRIDQYEGTEATGGIRESPALLGDRYDETVVERERED
jgi:hypothetical protein